MHSASLRSTFVRVFKFLQINKGGPNFWLELTWHSGCIIWSTILYFNFKSLKDPNCSPFVRFECILFDSGVTFSNFWNFYKLKEEDLISGVNQFCRTVELFGRPFCITKLKVSRTEILPEALHLTAFWLIREYFSQSLQFTTN